MAPWSGQRQNLARAFLEDCLANHATCSYAESPLPTRVIEVGSTTRDPYLYTSNGDTGPYITLSHCWGGASPITTTTGTIGTRSAGIRFTTLPKTFQDAVLITRDLGIRYLWIDSLCILQDSNEDWEREAARMADVYANGYVMLAADGSENCHGGCFPRAGGPSFPIAAPGPVGRSSKVYCRLTNVLADDLGEVCHSLHDPQGGFRRNALDSRGWTLQERILAPRTLHFGNSEIGWECASKRACECQVVATQTDWDSRFKAQLVNSQGRIADRPNSLADSAGDRWLWSNIVEEFTRRNLTNSKDILPALSGLAKRMCLGAEGEYISGMWRKKLPGFLMWRPDYYYIRSNSLSRVPRRHERYYAPSWSWASVIGPITYENLDRQSDLTKWKEPYPIRKGECGWDDERTNGLLTILEVRSVQKGLNPFGPSKSAQLHVHGYMASARLHSSEKSLPYQSSNNGGLLLGTGESSPAQADFEPDVLDTYREVSIGDEVHLLFVMEYRGLILAAAAEGGGLYSRIGTFYFQAAEAHEKWREGMKERTIWLI